MRRGAPTARFVVRPRRLTVAGIARLLSRRRRTFGWLLVEVGLKLAVQEPERGGEHLDERRAAA